MSRGSRHHVLGAVTGLAAIALAASPGASVAEGALPELSPPPEVPPESIHAAAEFVESEVVAENRRLREENERLLAELGDAREREIAAQREAPMVAFERTPIGTFAETDLGHRRAVFDASVPMTIDGKRVTFAPGDDVPAHIDPSTLPAGAVRYVPEEG